MILKSTSRKGNSGGFAQLYDYITEKAQGQCIFHNFLYHQPNRARTIREFTDNAKHIKQTKRHNILYHEILSIKRGAKDQQERQVEALRDLSQQYLAMRAKGQLAYCALHTDQAETIHIHMMISANEVGSKKRSWLYKHEFLQIQKDLEANLQRDYPELEEKTIYNKPWEQSHDISDKEQKLKSRTKAPSQKDQLRETLQQIFHRAPSKEAAEQALRDMGITLNQRGKSITATKGTLKCRLKTLKLDQDYENIGKIKSQEAKPKEENSYRERWDKALREKDAQREQDDGMERER